MEILLHMTVYLEKQHGNTAADGKWNKAPAGKKSGVVGHRLFMDTIISYCQSSV
jgi:hypothetical protein